MGPKSRNESSELERTRPASVHARLREEQCAKLGGMLACSGADEPDSLPVAKAGGDRANVEFA